MNAKDKTKTNDTINEYYMETVPLFLTKDRKTKNDDLTVTVNGVNYQIKRGVKVSVPRCVALAVERSLKQEADAEEYIDSLKNA